MAVSVASLTHGSDSDGNSTCTTASVTPAANKLQLLTVVSRTGITADPNIPTITGNSLTWAQVATVVYDNTSSSRRRLTLFRAMGASPSSGTISIDFGGQNQTNVVWTLDEATGMDTSGTNGSGAIVQSATNFDNATGTPVSTLTVTLAAFGNANNGTYGVFGNGVATDTATAGSGFSKVSEDNSGGTTIRLTSEYKSTNDTSVDMSWSNVSELGGIAAEIKNGAVDITVSPSVQSSTLSQQSATISTVRNVTTTPSVQSIVSSQQSATTTTQQNITVTPSYHSVVSSQNNISIDTVQNRTVQPSAIGLVSNDLSPSIIADREAIVSVSAQTITTSQPITSVIAEQNITTQPLALSLTTNIADPSITTTSNAVISVVTQSIIGDSITPIIEAIRNVIITPSVLSLIFDSPALHVSVDTPVIVSTSAQSISISLNDITITSDKNVSIPVGVAQIGGYKKLIFVDGKPCWHITGRHYIKI